MHQIIDTILNSKAKLIAIDGVDAAGKTSFAKDLAENLRALNKEVLVVSIDSFHQPKSYRYRLGEDSADGFFYDSYQYSYFIENCIAPLKSGLEKIAIKCFNLENDKEEIKVTDVESETIVIVEGIFLHRDELFQIWDYSIFLDVSVETSLERNLKRSLAVNANLDIEGYKDRFYKRYKAGQELYFSKCSPKFRAKFVLDNN